MGPGNLGKYMYRLEFTLAFFNTGQSLKVVGGPGKSGFEICKLK